MFYDSNALARVFYEIMKHCSMLTTEKIALQTSQTLSIISGHVYVPFSITLRQIKSFIH